MITMATKKTGGRKPRPDYLPKREFSEQFKLTEEEREQFTELGRVLDLDRSKTFRRLIQFARARMSDWSQNKV